MRRFASVVALMLVACGSDPEPSAPIAAAHDPSPPRAPEPDPTPVAAPVEPDEPIVPRVTFAIPAEGALPHVAPLPFAQIDSRGARWEEVRHPDPIARRRLAQLVEQLAYVAGFLPPWVAEDRGGCRVRLATERVVAMECRPLYWHRSGDALPAEGRTAAHFVVDGSEVRPFALEEALAPGRTWADLIDVPHCVAQLAARHGMGRAPRFCRDELPRAQAVLTPRGIDLLLGNTDVISRSFQSVREHLREEGPIAWLFAGVDRAPPPGADEADGWAVGEVAPLGELASRFAAWPVEVRASVRIADRSRDAAQPVIPRALGYARALAVATALGATPRRTRWEGEPLRLARARLARDALLGSAARDRVALRALPAGTIVTVATSAADGLGAPEDVVRAALALRQGGWLPVSALAPHEACTPDPRALLEPLGESERADAEERMTIAEITLGGDPPRPATLFVTRVGGRTHARIEARTGDCTPGEAIFAADVAGLVYDARTTTTEPDGAGDALLVLGLLRGREDRRYEVHHVASGRRVLEHRFDPEERDPDDVPGLLDETRFHQEEDGERWPLTIGFTRYRWNGRIFVEDEPPR